MNCPTISRLSSRRSSYTTLLASGKLRRCSSSTMLRSSSAYRWQSLSASNAGNTLTWSLSYRMHLPCTSVLLTLTALILSTIIAEYIAERAQVTRERIQWLLDLEARPRTLNDHYFRDYRDKFLAYYRGHRSQYNNIPLLQKLKKHTSNGSSEFDENVRNILAAFSALDVHDVQPTDLAKVLPSDPYEAAINIMASVRAYFQGMSPSANGLNVTR